MILTGDARAVLSTLAAASVDCCVTSPPYWGLRDYGVDGQIGLEPTPEAYVAALMEVFRQVRRVLRADGTLWLNLGDTYSNAGTRQGDRGGIGLSEHRKVGNGYRPRVQELKNKDLCGIPWRVAFALQADGWYLRSDIIWSKPNPMPESVADRPTKAHEYVFLLSKQERYYYDADAIAEPIAESQTGRVRSDPIGGSSWRNRGQHSQGSVYTNGTSRIHGAMSAVRRDGAGSGLQEQGFQTGIFETQNRDETSEQILLEERISNPPTRNKRSIWTLTTYPVTDAHFATYPIELPEICIRAGSRENGTVLDPFTGSGTTALACVKTNRKFTGIELNPEYVTICERRLERHYSLFRD